MNWQLISKVDFYFSYRILSYPTHHLNRSQTHAVFQHAFNKWSSVANLDFVEEKNYYKNADITIKFGSRRHGDSIAFDGPGGLNSVVFSSRRSWKYFELSLLKQISRGFCLAGLIICDHLGLSELSQLSVYLHKKCVCTKQGNKERHCLCVVVVIVLFKLDFSRRSARTRLLSHARAGLLPRR